MPTATLAEIMDALADQIWESINNVLDVDVQVEPRWVRNPTLPCVDMRPGDPSKDPDLRAFGELVGGELIEIRARVSAADTEAGQDLLLALMDDEDDLSIARAIDADETLGGVASTLDCRDRSGMDESLDGDVFWATWQVVVVKAKS
jgi:hypothetical protein